MDGRRAVARAVVLALMAAGLVRLAVWQWDRGQESGRLLHYTYAAEWLLVALLLVWPLLPRRRPRPGPPAGSYDASGRVLGPPLGPGEQLPPTTRERAARLLRRRGPT